MTFLEKVRVETESFLDQTFDMSIEELLTAPNETLEEAIEKFDEKIVAVDEKLSDLDMEKLKLKTHLERYKKQRFELLNRLKHR